MILPISKGGCFGTITVYGKVCIGYTSLRKHIPKNIKPIRNRKILHADEKHV